MTDRPSLPRALRANALASLITGCAGVLMSAPLAQTIGVLSGQTYQVLGALLLIHTAVLLWATGREAIRFWARMSLAGLAIYVAILVALLLFATFASGAGQSIVLLDAVLVSALAAWQWRALRFSTPRPAR